MSGSSSLWHQPLRIDFREGKSLLDARVFCPRMEMIMMPLIMIMATVMKRSEFIRDIILWENK